MAWQRGNASKNNPGSREMSLSPVPAVLVSCGGTQGWKPNLITIAWTGNVCSDPPMLSISVRPERYSYEIIQTTREFVVNVPSLRQAKAVDWCGVVSGRSEDKFAGTGLTPGAGPEGGCPIVAGMSAQHRMPGAEIPEAGLAHDVCGGGGRRAGLFALLDAKGRLRLEKRRLAGVRPRPVFRAGTLHRPLRLFRPEAHSLTAVETICCVSRASAFKYPKYASRLRISGALHLDIFEQPAREPFRSRSIDDRGET